jgi:formylglycine-generating enzyme required for sulfatase activity
VLKKTLASAREAPQKSAILTSTHEFVAALVQAEKFATAAEVMDTATKVALASNYLPLIEQWRLRQKEFNELAVEFKQLPQARTDLASDPLNRDANFVVGKFHCFAKGEWKIGITYLSLSSDEELRKLANEELNSTTTVQQQLSIADRWWEIAQKQPELLRKNVLAHAKGYYSSATPGLTGLDATRATKRLETLKDIQSAPDDGPSNTIINSIGMRLVKIEPGEFLMGSTEQEGQLIGREAKRLGQIQWTYDRVPFESPRQKVVLTRTYYIGAYEVTRQQYNQIMGKPAPDKADAQLPIQSITWTEADRFCKILTAKSEEAKEARIYRLPSEAEWEYACRAGSTERYPFGADVERLGDYAWVNTNSEKKLHAVGGKLPNQFGCYDMLGNVQEWCEDWYKQNTYKSPSRIDPKGPSEGHGRVVRGGAAGHSWLICRSAARNYGNQNGSSHDIGFRVVCYVKK